MNQRIRKGVDLLKFKAYISFRKSCWILLTFLILINGCKSFCGTYPVLKKAEYFAREPARYKKGTFRNPRKFSI